MGDFALGRHIPSQAKAEQLRTKIAAYEAALRQTENSDVVKQVLERTTSAEYQGRMVAFALVAEKAQALLGVRAGDNLQKIISRGTMKTKYGFEFFPEGDPLKMYVQFVEPWKNYFGVAMHGTPTGVCFGSSEETNMSARLLAEVIRHSEGYHGQPVRLLSCSTGLSTDGSYCFAEELANALGVPVRAPIVSGKKGYNGSPDGLDTWKGRT